MVADGSGSWLRMSRFPVWTPDVHKSCLNILTVTETQKHWDLGGGFPGMPRVMPLHVRGVVPRVLLTFTWGVRGCLGLPGHLRGLGWKSLIKGYHLMAAWRGPFLLLLIQETAIYCLIKHMIWTCCCSLYGSEEAEGGSKDQVLGPLRIAKIRKTIMTFAIVWLGWIARS